jgi:hypothetical protein
MLARIDIRIYYLVRYKDALFPPHPDVRLCSKTTRQPHKFSLYASFRVVIQIYVKSTCVIKMALLLFVEHYH